MINFHWQPNSRGRIHGDIIRVLPPFVITDEDIQYFVTSLDDVLASGLLAPGSIARRALLFSGGAAALESFRAEATGLLRPQDRLLDYRDGRPEVRTAIGNAERFLELAALVSVLLGGVAVAMAARRFVARRLDAVALMKCLGLRYREVLALHLVQLLLLVAAAGVLGSVAGFLAQFGLTAALA